MISAELLSQLNTTDEELAKLLEDDVQEIFSTMVGAQVSSGTTASTTTQFRRCVTAMVGFTGVYNGLISISSPERLAMQFASQMLGMEVDECNDDVHDAMGEITNMMGGSFKQHFIKDGHEVRLSTPSVISGREYTMTVGLMPETMTLAFSSGEDNFTVSVYLEPGN